MFGAARLTQSGIKNATGFDYIGGGYRTIIGSSSDTSQNYIGYAGVTPRSGDFVFLGNTAWAPSDVAPTIPVPTGFTRIYLNQTSVEPVSPNVNFTFSVSYCRLNGDSDFSRIYNVASSNIDQNAIIGVFRPNGKYKEASLVDINGDIDISGGSSSFVIDAASSSGPLLTLIFYILASYNGGVPVPSNDRIAKVPGSIDTPVSMTEVGVVTTFFKYKNYNSSQTGEDVQIQFVDEGETCLLGFYLKLTV